MTHHTLLIVDDDPADLAELSRCLRPDYRPLSASSGEEALRLLGGDERPDLILLDARMPGLDGTSLLTRLQRDPELRQLPVLLLITRQDGIDEEQAIALGAADFIRKPFKPLVLKARVRTHLELRRWRMSAEQEQSRPSASQWERYSQVLQNAILGTLAGLVETREPESSQHIPRTRRHVEILATRLAALPRFAADLTPARISLIGKASQLHDIGKIGIPERILLKPGGLDATEFEVIKTHSRLGGEILTRVMGQAEAALAEYPAEERQAALAYLELARAIATSHHERWDGGGYPAGLIGEAIPLPARLMALADVFDAFTTRRVYKPALGLAVTRDYIQSQSGKQFDPQVVEAFIAGFAEFARIAQAYPDPRPA